MTTDEARRLFEEKGCKVLISKIDGKPVYESWECDYAAVSDEMVPYVQAAIDRKEWPWPLQWLAYDSAPFRKVWYVKKLTAAEQDAPRAESLCDEDDIGPWWDGRLEHGAMQALGKLQDWKGTRMPEIKNRNKVSPQLNQEILYWNDESKTWLCGYYREIKGDLWVKIGAEPIGNPGAIDKFTYWHLLPHSPIRECARCGKPFGTDCSLEYCPFCEYGRFEFKWWK